MSKDKKQLKAERKAAALAKQEAIANGTWVEPNKPKAKKDDVEEVVVDDSVHLLHVYSSQAGCMSEWIKHAHKPEGTEVLFYSFNALQPLVNTIRSFENGEDEYYRLIALVKDHKLLLSARKRDLAGYNWLTKMTKKVDYNCNVDDIQHLKYQIQCVEKRCKETLEQMFDFCAVIQQHKETL